MAAEEDVTLKDYLSVMKAFTSYSRAIDDSNWPQLADAFAPDAVWVMADGTESHGLEEIKALLVAALEVGPYRALHAVANIDLDFQGDVVRSTSNWMYFVRKTPAEGEAPTRQMAVPGAWDLGSVGTYEDTLEKIDGRWLFTYRRIHNWEFSEPNVPSTD